jgi:hypothetical protein
MPRPCNTGKLAKIRSRLALARACQLAFFAAGLAVALPIGAQQAGAQCPAAGFDVCFPNLTAGAPNAACNPAEPDAAAITACLGSVCGGAAREPEPGFFGYCCAQGGSVRYDDFCVFVVQSSCDAVADHCVDSCPPLALLIGSVPLAPPPAACIGGYPPFIAAVCAADPFCCTTSWDVICATAALEASGR